MTPRSRLRPLSLTFVAALLATAGCTSGPDSEADASSGASGSATTEPSGEATSEAEETYPEQRPEGYPIKPAVTVFGERALSPCRLIPIDDVGDIYGSVGEVPQDDTFLERSVPYPGLARDSDQALTTECTLYGTTVVTLRIDPVPPGDLANSGLSYDAESGKRYLTQLDAWEKKSPDDDARALIDRLLADARKAKKRDPFSDKPQKIWALTDFKSVHDFDLETIVDHQKLELGVYSDTGSPQGRSAWVTAAGQLGRLVELIEANLANPDLPQGPWTTTTGATENDDGVPLPEPCSIFTAAMFRTLFGVPANAPTGHGAADTTFFSSDRPTRLTCERVFEAGNLARPGAGVVARFGEGGDWQATVEIAAYDSEQQARKSYLEERGAPSHEVATRADQAYIAYSPDWGVTVSAMRVGPFIVSVSYYGEKARAGIDFASIELGEPAPATTIRFFNLLTPAMRDVAKGA
jgi:hypothetical protein